MINWSELWLRARYQWYVVHWLLVVLVLAVPAFMFTLGAQNIDRSNIARMAPVDARIVSIQARETQYPSVQNTVVIARTSTGATGRAVVSGTLIRGCRIGDPIAAWQKGFAVTIRPAPCQQRSGR